jgi:hypothetical protein
MAKRTSTFLIGEYPTSAIWGLNRNEMRGPVAKRRQATLLVKMLPFFERYAALELGLEWMNR